MALWEGFRIKIVCFRPFLDPQKTVFFLKGGGGKKVADTSAIIMCFFYAFSYQELLIVCRIVAIFRQVLVLFELEVAWPPWPPVPSRSWPRPQSSLAPKPKEDAPKKKCFLVVEPLGSCHTPTSSRCAYFFR